MAHKRERIEINPVQGGLNSAFAHFDLPAASPAPPLRPEPSAPPVKVPKKSLGRVVLRREKAQRGGKTVIVVHDFATHLRLSEIEEFARKLRAACGCGGTVKDRTIEIQGDQAGRIRTLLEQAGFQVAGVS